ncbi:histone-lysine N-methyltransferase SETMAR [Trichonephila clavipes]|nr:histone-lysine N-methyltransferase SETMAR [Trichonephila clavipes]
MLHHDNASSHTVGLKVEFLKQKQIKVIEHPPYSPNLTMCGFWLFFNLKKELTRTSFSFRRGYRCNFFQQFYEMNESMGWMGLGSRSPIGFGLLQGEWAYGPDIALLISGMKTTTEMNGLRHLKNRKFVYKSALMLEETTLNSLKIL